MQDKELYTLYSDYIKDDMFLKKNFYLDITLFKDIYLGIIFSHIQSHLEYKKIYDFIHSDKYKNRLIDNKDVWFDDSILNISHDQLIDTFKNEKSHDELFKISPNINIINLLKELVLKSLECHTILKDSTEVICLFINIYPLRLSKSYIDVLRINLERMLSIKCKIINKSTQELFDDKITNYDCWLIYNLNKILELDPFGEKEDLDKLDKFQKIAFLTPKLIHDVSIIETKSIDEIDNDFKFCEQYLNMFFEFSFINPTNIYVES